MPDLYENQLAWHVKPGDMLVLWTEIPTPVGIQHKRMPYLCYSVVRQTDNRGRSGKWVTLGILNWTFPEVELPWQESVDIVSMAHRLTHDIT